MQLREWLRRSFRRKNQEEVAPGPMNRAQRRAAGFHTRHYARRPLVATRCREARGIGPHALDRRLLRRIARAKLRRALNREAA